jgi:hypothetical protein
VRQALYFHIFDAETAPDAFHLSQGCLQALVGAFIFTSLMMILYNAAVMFICTFCTLHFSLSYQQE